MKKIISTVFLSALCAVLCIHAAAPVRVLASVQGDGFSSIGGGGSKQTGHDSAPAQPQTPPAVPQAQTPPVQAPAAAETPGKEKKDKTVSKTETASGSETEDRDKEIERTESEKNEKRNFIITTLSAKKDRLDIRIVFENQVEPVTIISPDGKSYTPNAPGVYEEISDTECVYHIPDAESGEWVAEYSPENNQGLDFSVTTTETAEDKPDETEEPAQAVSQNHEDPAAGTEQEQPVTAPEEPKPEETPREQSKGLHYFKIILFSYIAAMVLVFAIWCIGFAPILYRKNEGSYKLAGPVILSKAEQGYRVKIPAFIYSGSGEYRIIFKNKFSNSHFGENLLIQAGDGECVSSIGHEVSFYI